MSIPPLVAHVGIPYVLGSRNGRNNTQTTHEAGILVSYMQSRQYRIITLIPTTQTPNYKRIYLYRLVALEQGLSKRFIFVQLGLGSILEGRW